MHFIFCLNFDTTLLPNSISYDENTEYFAEKTYIIQVLLLW
jgi:hypothetical protein